MKKKTIIIAGLSALVLAGVTVGAVYAFDRGVSSEVASPEKTAVLVKDDPSIEVDISDIDMTRPHAESRKRYRVEHERVRSVIDDVVAEVMDENPDVKEINISENDCMDMTREQIKLYAELYAKVKSEAKVKPLGQLPRIISQARGEMPLDAPRLTVEALNEIISQSADENELWKKIMDQYGSSDQWMSFSGVAGFETRYWLNDDGSKYISYLYHFNRSKTTICYGENVTVLYSNESCNHTPFDVE